MDVNDITSAEWSLSLRGQGEVEQGFDDINQCIKLIVSTQRGTDPMRPNFGCDLWRFMDYGINVAAARMTNEILSALATWETRIEITNINYSTLKESVTFNILWILQGNKQSGSASITLDFAPQRQTEAPPVIIAPIDVPVLSAVYTYPDGVLSWTFPSPIGVSFQILRSANGGALEQIGTAFSVLEYTDIDLDFDTEFAYQIRAVKGSRVSDFSNAVAIQTLTPYLEFSASAPLYIDIQKTGTADIVQSEDGTSKVYLLDDDPENITEFLADDAGDDSLNAGITGILDLGDVYSGLRTIRARSQDFTLLAGDWVRNASVSIDVSNSVISLDRITALIDNIILANGGTITDNGTSYTGVPGESHASRLLGIGSLELDLLAPENAILYEKIIALETVGWAVSTVSTLCEKTLIVDTGGSYFSSGFIERTRNLESIVFVGGDPLSVKLYDTEANAGTGGATGLLADGYTAVDTWLRNDSNYNAWALGTVKGIRFEAVDTGSTNNESNLVYLAAPTDDRPCGENELGFDYLAGNAQVFDGVFDYDVVDMPKTGLFNVSDSRVLVFTFFYTQNGVVFSYGNAGGLAETGFFILITGNKISLQVRDSLGGRIAFVCNENIIPNSYNVFTIEKGNSWNASDIKVYLNGIEQLKSVTIDGITQNVNASQDVFIGRRASGGPFFGGKIKQLEILNRAITATERIDLFETGSLRGAGIAHNSGEYLLAVDFDKTNGQDPTTFADTPTYTITAFGGSTYESYL